MLRNKTVVKTAHFMALLVFAFSTDIYPLALKTGLRTLKRKMDTDDVSSPNKRQRKQLTSIQINNFFESGVKALQSYNFHDAFKEFKYIKENNSNFLSERYNYFMDIHKQDPAKFFNLNHFFLYVFIITKDIYMINQCAQNLSKFDTNYIKEQFSSIELFLKNHSTRDNIIDLYIFVGFIYYLLGDPEKIDEIFSNIKKCPDDSIQAIQKLHEDSLIFIQSEKFLYANWYCNRILFLNPDDKKATIIIKIIDILSKKENIGNINGETLEWLKEQYNYFWLNKEYFLSELCKNYIIKYYSNKYNFKSLYRFYSRLARNYSRLNGTENCERKQFYENKAVEVKNKIKYHKTRLKITKKLQKRLNKNNISIEYVEENTLKQNFIEACYEGNGSIKIEKDSWKRFKPKEFSAFIEIKFIKIMLNKKYKDLYESSTNPEIELTAAAILLYIKRFPNKHILDKIITSLNKYIYISKIDCTAKRKVFLIAFKDAIKKCTHFIEAIKKLNSNEFETILKQLSLADAELAAYIYVNLYKGLYPGQEENLQRLPKEYMLKSMGIEQTNKIISIDRTLKEKIKRDGILIKFATKNTLNGCFIEVDYQPQGVMKIEKDSCVNFSDKVFNALVEINYLKLQIYKKYYYPYYDLKNIDTEIVAAAILQYIFLLPSKRRLKIIVKGIRSYLDNRDMQISHQRKVYLETMLTIFSLCKENFKLIRGLKITTDETLLDQLYEIGIDDEDALDLAVNVYGNILKLNAAA